MKEMMKKTMRRTIFLTFTMLIICAASFNGAAQTASEDGDDLRQLDQRIKAADAKLRNNPCEKTPARCTDKAKVEHQNLLNDYYQLKNERDTRAKKAQRTDFFEQSFRKSVLGRFLENFGVLLIFIIPVFFIGFIILIATRSRTKSHSDSHGSAIWAKDAELKAKDFIRTPQQLQSGNLVIGLQNKNELVVLPEKLTFLHGAVLGASGTGKSRFFFMPNLYYMKDKVSVFVHDTKSELWETTSGHWKNAARFAPYDPDNSLGFNWIPFCTDENSLLTVDLAETIITNGNKSKGSDPFWEDSETALLAGMFSHVATTDCPTPAYCYDLITTLNLDQLISLMRNSKSGFANEQANFVEDAPDRVKQGILAGIRRTLTWLRDEKIRRFTSSTMKKPNLEVLRQGKIALYWCLPQTYSERLRPLTCLALKLLMFQLRQTQGENVYLLLDEFDALGQIPRFESDLTLLRSEKVAIIAGIQSIAQLAKNYGRESAQVILDNLQTKIILHGLEYETAERISKNLGELTLTEDAVSVSKRGFFEGNTKTVSQRKHARRLMTADEIRRIDEDLALIITSNIKPFIKQKVLFKADTPPVNKYKCGTTKTRPVERKTTEKPKGREMPDFPL